VVKYKYQVTASIGSRSILNKQEYNMPIVFGQTGGDGDSSLPTTIPTGKHAVSDGSNLIESDLQENGTTLSTTKNFFANTLTAAQASVEIGPALTLSAGGGEVLQRSVISSEEVFSILPRKRYDNVEGTGGRPTIGRILGQQQTITLFVGDSLRSDDLTAIVPPNDITGKVTYTITATENRFITKYFMRFATVRTGVRQVWRFGAADGPVIFESEPDRLYEEGIGTTTKVYDGTPATETTFAFAKDPLVLLEGDTYYITLESNVGYVVTYGDLESGKYKPYTRREIQDLSADPVVARSTDVITEDIIVDDNDWHHAYFVDASAGDVQVTLPTAIGSLAKGMAMVVTKMDSSSNLVTIIPHSGETIDDNGSYVLSEQYQNVGLMSDGSNVHVFIRPMEGVVYTQAEKDKLASITGGRYLGVFADLTALQTAHPTGVEGDSATVTSPSGNLFFWNGSAWEDSGTGSSGDMLKAIYDPTTKAVSVFDMDNMDESLTKKIFTALERTKLSLIEDEAEVNNLTDVQATDLTDMGDSDLHYHQSDRVRSNHLGTQLASTISNFDTAVEANSVVAANTEDVTLAADTTTQETLDIAGQELTVNVVTQTTDGAMIAEDKLKLDNITDNGGGDDWVSGLDVTEHSPKNQTVDYTAGSYLIDGNLQTIASGGVYDLENAYGSVDHYNAMVDYQHRFILLYVDVNEVLKSVAGAIAEKHDVPPLPYLPDDSVGIALVEIKVDKNDNPKDIKNKEITDTRNSPAYNTDEFVRVSADDLGVGHLSDKLTDNGNVTFTVENPAGIETLKADVDIANDAAVILNTAKVSADGSVTSHSDVTSSGSGEIITVAERSDIASALQNGDNVSELINDAGYLTSVPAGTYSDLHRSSVGNQKIKNVGEILEFNTSGPSNGAVASTGDDSLTIPTSGDYNIVFSGSAKIKKDVLYSFSVQVNGSTLLPLGNIESASDNYLRTFSYAMMLTLSASDEVKIYAITDSATDKDFYMQIGTSFTIVKL
jgi:hypothetical protein